MARVNEQGMYKVFTAGGQGLPLGDYQVSIAEDGPLIETNMDTGKIVFPSGSRKSKARIPRKYQDEHTSGLTVTVSTGENQYDISMSSNS